MWDLIKELFGSGKSLAYRLALGAVLGGIALFAVWTSIPSSIRESMLKTFMAKPGLPERQLAAKVADSLEGRVPALPASIGLAYYAKPSDSLVTTQLMQLLQLRGFILSRPPYTRPERSDAVWCGAEVSNADCILVALRMVQTGLLVRQVFRFPPERKRRAVEIGHNDNLATLSPLPVASLLSRIASGIPIDGTPP